MASGVLVENRAGIFFDFNPPILTNSVSSILVETLPNFTPQAAFSFTLTDLTAQFTDLPTNTPTAWFWDFGGGNTSDEQHPAHSFATLGEFEVCLTASNAWGSHQTCQELVIVTGTGERLDATCVVFPNPVRSGGRVYLSGVEVFENEEVVVKNSLGQTMCCLRPALAEGERMGLQFPALPGGIYFIEAGGTEGRWAVKIVVKWQGG